MHFHGPRGSHMCVHLRDAFTRSSRIMVICIAIYSYMHIYIYICVVYEYAQKMYTHNRRFKIWSACHSVQTGTRREDQYYRTALS